MALFNQLNHLLLSQTMCFIWRRVPFLEVKQIFQTTQIAKILCQNKYLHFIQPLKRVRIKQSQRTTRHYPMYLKARIQKRLKNLLRLQNFPNEREKREHSVILIKYLQECFRFSITCRTKANHQQHLQEVIHKVFPQ